MFPPSVCFNCTICVSAVELYHGKEGIVKRFHEILIKKVTAHLGMMCRCKMIME